MGETDNDSDPVGEEDAVLEPLTEGGGGVPVEEEVADSDPCMLLVPLLDGVDCALPVDDGEDVTDAAGEGDEVGETVPERVPVEVGDTVPEGETLAPSDCVGVGVIEEETVVVAVLVPAPVAVLLVVPVPVTVPVGVRVPVPDGDPADDPVADPVPAVEGVLDPDGCDVLVPEMVYVPEEVAVDATDCAEERVDVGVPVTVTMAERV